MRQDVLESMIGSTLDRFRRVAKNNRVEVSSDIFLDEFEEIKSLRAGLNAQIYPKAQSWMLPYWAVRTLEQKGIEKISLEFLFNDSYRNWSTVGGPDSKHYAIVDQKGLLTAISSCGSIDVWVKNEEEIIFPASSQDGRFDLILSSPEDQIYEWKITLRANDFTRMVYHVVENEIEAIYNEIHIRNHSLEESHLTFYVALRPMSALGVEPIESLHYDAKNGLLFANNILALSMNKQPTSLVMSTADNPNLLNMMKTSTNRIDREFSATRGLATAIIRFDVTLPPAHSERLFFISPLLKQHASEKLAKFTAQPYMRDTTISNWFGFSSSSSSGQLPEEVLDSLVVQDRAILTIQAQSVLLGSILSWREKARIILALCKSGCLDQAKSVANTLTETIDFHEDENNPNILSPIIWLTLQPYFSSQDLDFLKAIHPFLVPGLDRLYNHVNLEMSSIEEKEPAISEEEEFAPQETADLEKKSSFLGIDEIKAAMEEALAEEQQSETVEPLYAPIPELIGIADEDITEPPIAYALHDIVVGLWNYSALVAGLQAFEAISDGENSGKFAEIVNRYQQYIVNISQTLQESFEDWSSELSTTGEAILDALELISGIALLGNPGFDFEFVDGVADAIANKSLSKHLIKLPNKSGKFSGHLAFRLGQYYALRNRNYDIEQILNRALSFISEHYALPEYVNTKTGGGFYGNGCSIKAAADLLLLISMMVAFGKGNDLVILPAIPEKWYTSSHPLIINRFPTQIGYIDIEVGASANQHQIEVRMDQLPQELEVYLPSHIALPMVKVFGGSIVGRFPSEESPHLKVVPHTESVVFTFHR